jgi:hypothetical protein
MPKCTFSGCDQTAFYGYQFNQPKFCKLHMPAGSITVKKKCTSGECQNAISMNRDLCQRCMDVEIAISDFRMRKLDELDAIIRKENAALAQPTMSTSASAQPQTAGIAVLSATKRMSKQGATASVSPSMFTPPSHVPPKESAIAQSMQAIAQMPAVSALQKPKPTSTISAGSKIVRIPDEPKTKLQSDFTSAKKRTQTPGRPRGAHLDADAKAE